MGFETPEEGYLAKIFIPAGVKNIPVGKLLCIIVEEESQIEAFKNYSPPNGNSTSPSTPSTTDTSSTPSEPKTSTPSSAPMTTSDKPAPTETRSTPKPPITPITYDRSDRVYASPMAKRLAEQRNIRLQGKGTGIFDSIISTDLESLMPTQMVDNLSATSVSGPGVKYIDIPLSNMRSVIAKRLVHSKQSIPHYYLNVDVNIDHLMELRSRFNKTLENDHVKLSLNDFIIKASALACLKVPEVNSSWQDSFIRR